MVHARGPASTGIFVSRPGPTWLFITLFKNCRNQHIKVNYVQQLVMIELHFKKQAFRVYCSLWEMQILLTGLLVVIFIVFITRMNRKNPRKRNPKLLRPLVPILGVTNV